MEIVEYLIYSFILVVNIVFSMANPMKVECDALDKHCVS